MKTEKKTTAQLLKNSGMILEELRGGVAEVCARQSTELSVVYEGNDFSVSKSNNTSTYGIRAIINGKLGFITSNSDEEHVLREVAEETRKLAHLSLPSEHHRIAEKKTEGGSYENYDEKLPGLTPEELYQWLQLVVDEARREKVVSLDRAEFSCARQVVVLSNSHGLCQQAIETHCSWFAMGMGKTENEVTSFDYDGGTVWNKNSLEKEIIHTIGRFRESVVGSLGPRQAKDYRGAVLLHPVAVMHILGQVIAFNANGKNHYDGISSWKDQMGNQVCSGSLQVAEDPLDKNRPEGWSPFDREGVASAKHEIIRQGQLQFAAHNCFSAHQAGVSPTGNASGGATALPQIGFSNFSLSGIKNQTVSENALYQQLGSGLVLKRFSGSCDPVSGQFSGVAKNSWWVEKGQRSHAVQEIMVSGNVFELLKQIIAIGSTLHTNLGGSRAPYILVDGVSVTSA